MRMNTAKYIKLFLTASTVYALFLVRGLNNNHYLDWSLDFQIADCLEIVVFTLPLTYLPLKWFSTKKDYFADSIWFAFFLSVPFAIYDMIYAGIIRGHGPGYFGTFLFLTIFYFIVLIEVPLIGYLMQKDDPKIAKKHFLMLLLAIIAWLLNWWEGSFSGHYLQWSLNMKLVRLTNIALLLWTIAAVFLMFNSTRADYLKDARFLALYFSFVFILFDFLYLGIARGAGLGYVKEYWFVAVWYPVFWVEFPFIGWSMLKINDKDSQNTSLEKGRRP